MSLYIGADEDGPRPHLSPRVRRVKMFLFASSDFAVTYSTPWKKRVFFSKNTKQGGSQYNANVLKKIKRDIMMLKHYWTINGIEQKAVTCVSAVFALPRT